MKVHTRVGIVADICFSQNSLGQMGGGGGAGFHIDRCKQVVNIVCIYMCGGGGGVPYTIYTGKYVSDN